MESAPLCWYRGRVIGNARNVAPASRPAVVRASSPALVQEQILTTQPKHSCISPICVECGVDREVHVTAGQEAGATYSTTGNLCQAGYALYTNRKNALPCFFPSFNREAVFGQNSGLRGHPEEASHPLDAFIVQNIVNVGGQVGVDGLFGDR
jgi:hypothetical protein